MGRIFIACLLTGVIIFFSCGRRTDDVRPGTDENLYVSVLPKKVNFRQRPDEDAPLVPSRPFLFYGQFGKVLEKRGDWVRVKCQFDEEGWVLSVTSGVECTYELPGDYFETRLTAGEALAAADDKIMEWGPDSYVVAMVAPLEDFGGRCAEWTVVYRDASRSIGSNGAFRAVIVRGAEIETDDIIWSTDGDAPSFIKIETGEYFGYRLFDENDAGGRASLTFLDSDELFRGNLPDAVMDLPPVADGSPGEYFGANGRWSTGAAFLQAGHVIFGITF